MSIILQPGELTRGELLFIIRRRRKLTWYKAAEKWKVAKRLYRGWEKDTIPGAPRATVYNVTQIEKCTIQRRRWKITQDQLAKEIKMSRAWINQMEKGVSEPARLIFYWKKLNGQRPPIANV